MADSYQTDSQCGMSVRKTNQSVKQSDSEMATVFSGKWQGTQNATLLQCGWHSLFPLDYFGPHWHLYINICINLSCNCNSIWNHSFGTGNEVSSYCNLYIHSLVIWLWEKQEIKFNFINHSCGFDQSALLSKESLFTLTFSEWLYAKPVVILFPSQC